MPADHPDKSKEIGSEATPAEFIDIMLQVTAELRRVLAPHGSIAIELGDTYAGSGGAGGDYNADGLRDGQQKFSGSAAKRAKAGLGDEYRPSRAGRGAPSVSPDGQTGYYTGRQLRPYGPNAGDGWPLAKSKVLIAELYRVALAYGINPLTGAESPAGRWRVRNVVTWVRPNPPVGALGDKWRPATSDLVVACTSGKRYWDDLATRKPLQHDYRNETGRLDGDKRGDKTDGQWSTLGNWDPSQSSGAPLLDWWEIPPGGYKGSHYAVFPEELVVPCVQAMCPPKVCRTCGEPSRRITGDTEYVNSKTGKPVTALHFRDGQHIEGQGNTVDSAGKGDRAATAVTPTLGWSDCGHNDYRPGLILDPFVGSGTTLAVATGYGHDAIGIDLDPRNAELALQRVGPFLLEVAQ